MNSPEPAWEEVNPNLDIKAFKEEESRWERRRDRELARNDSVPSFKAGKEGQNRKHWR
jgi:hypothetical protein